MPGIGISTSPFIGSSGTRYWNPQKIADTFLFYGETSKITGGKLYNQVKGSSDWLTVAGSAGSETYQAPNNATYQTADTDYIWFKTDATQRTVTTAELIGYDLQRSPVKYDGNSPNTIRKIGILKDGKVLTATELNQLFSFFALPVLWDNNLNINGHIKDNRVGQNLWTPESVVPEMLYTNTGGTGDRTAMIALTHSVGVNESGNTNILIDGVTGPVYNYYWNAFNTANEYFNFDFGAGKKKFISEVKFYQSTLDVEGVWKWQGSNEASATPLAAGFVDIGTSFTLGGAATQTITTMSANVTGYRHYRLLGVSGATNGNPYIYEFEFKIGE